MNFSSLIYFRYQSYLLNLLLSQNDSNFQDIGAVSEDIKVLDSWSSTIIAHGKNIGTFNFINQIMPRIHLINFQTNLPIISQDLKDLLQLSHDTRTGDWHFFKIIQ